MKILELLRKESESNVNLLIGVALVSGISNSALLIIINQAAENDSVGKDNTFLFMACLLAVGLYLLSNWFVQRKSAEHIEGIIRKIRIRITNKIRHSELATIEDLGQSEVFGRVTADTLIISQTVDIMVRAFQSGLLVLFSFIYIGFMSVEALAVIIGVILLGALSFYKTATSTEIIFAEASTKQNAFLNALNGFLLGFKEVKINSRKNNDAFLHFKEITDDASKTQVKAMFSMVNSNLISRMLFYLLLISIIFVIPAYEQTPDKTVVKISAAILFILGPLEGLISAIPRIVESNASAISIANLEKKVESELNKNTALFDPEDLPQYAPIAFDNAITIKNLEFQYPRQYDTDGFVVGPVNLSIPKNQITFITGGNGSGKSTFLKLFCGLYYPKSGEIMVDNARISRGNYRNYRELLSIVLTDFHLYDRLFGLPHATQEEIDHWLDYVQISHKTQIIDGKITNLSLSTGQRKRLALVISRLEQKSVYVFDEIAADQDPEFKKFFYTELLQQMQAEGKTVIVVTHDNEYFHVADACYQLKDGQLSPLKLNPHD